VPNHVEQNPYQPPTRPGKPLEGEDAPPSPTEGRLGLPGEILAFVAIMATTVTVIFLIGWLRALILPR
jgi:hypothetical protein